MPPIEIQSGLVIRLQNSPEGGSGEERVTSQKTGSVEVVTTPGKHEGAEDSDTGNPCGRHHCNATLPHVILRENTQKNLYTGAKSSSNSLNRLAFSSLATRNKEFLITCN